MIRARKACMGGGGPSVAPLPPPPPAPPTQVDPAVLAARQDAITAAANSKGRGSTILTQGDLDTSNTSSKKTLLGQ